MQDIKDIKILVVEDNQDEANLIKEVLKQIGVNTKLSVATDGEEAVKALKDLEVETLPDLIILDLKMPNMDGHELLSILKADKKYRRIPVVIFTTSESVKDLKDSYALGANCFITKPLEIQDFIKKVEFICDYWLNNAALPKSEMINNLQNN